MTRPIEKFAGERLLRRHVGELGARAPAERSAARCHDEPAHLLGATATQALRDRGVLDVDGHDLPRCGDGLDERAADDERLLVGERERRGRRRAARVGSRPIAPVMPLTTTSAWRAPRAPCSPQGRSTARGRAQDAWLRRSRGRSPRRGHPPRLQQPRRRGRAVRRPAPRRARGCHPPRPTTSKSRLRHEVDGLGADRAGRAEQDDAAVRGSTWAARCRSPRHCLAPARHAVTCLARSSSSRMKAYATAHVMRRRYIRMSSPQSMGCRRSARSSARRPRRVRHRRDELGVAVAEERQVLTVDGAADPAAPRWRALAELPSVLKVHAVQKCPSRALMRGSPLAVTVATASTFMPVRSPTSCSTVSVRSSLMMPRR